MKWKRVPKWIGLQKLKLGIRRTAYEYYVIQNREIDWSTCENNGIKSTTGTKWKRIGRGGRAERGLHKAQVRKYNWIFYTQYGFVIELKALKFQFKPWYSQKICFTIVCHCSIHTFSFEAFISKWMWILRLVLFCRTLRIYILNAWKWVNEIQKFKFSNAMQLWWWFPYDFLFYLTKFIHR